MARVEWIEEERGSADAFEGRAREGGRRGGNGNDFGSEEMIYRGRKRKRRKGTMTGAQVRHTMVE